MIRVLTVLPLVVALALAVGCSTSGPSNADLAKARAEGAAAERKKQADAAERKKQAALEARLKKLEKKIAKAQAAAKKTKPAGTSTQRSGLASAASCGGNIYVGSNTTCPFAINVADAWSNAGGGSVTVEAWSPVTKRYYLMSCTAGVPTICRGGIRAVVYIR